MVIRGRMLEMLLCGVLMVCVLWWFENWIVDASNKHLFVVVIDRPNSF